MSATLEPDAPTPAAVVWDPSLLRYRFSAEHPMAPLVVEVVRTLEQGGLDLDASLTLWERGEALARRCEEHLEGARERIETALGDVDADADDGDLADDDEDLDD